MHKKNGKNILGFLDFNLKMVLKELLNYVLIKVFKSLNTNEYENVIFSISFWPLGISKLAKPSKNVKRAWPQQQFVTNKNLTWGKLGIFVGVLFHKEFRQEKDLVITLSKRRAYTAKCLGRLIRVLRLLKMIRFEPNLFGFLYRVQIIDRYVTNLFHGNCPYRPR